MSKQERLPLDERRNMILNAAIAVIRDDGWKAVTRSAVSLRAKIGTGTINFAFGSMDNLRDELIRYAIKHPKEDAMLSTIANALVEGNTVAKNACDKIKQQALKTLY